MKDNLNNINNILWYNISENGSINGCFKNKAAIYIFRLKYDETPCYVGSSTKLRRRLNFHKWRVNNWNKDYFNNNGSLLFYNSVLDYGWNNFNFAILEHINSSNKSFEDKKILLEREQYYLNNINPSLNICKIAGSPLGIKHGISFSINLSQARRGKKNNVKLLNKSNRLKVIKSETKLKLSCRSQGISVKIFDQSNNLVNQFPTMTSAAKYLCVSDRTIRRILETGKSYDNYTYKFEVVDGHPITIINKENNFVIEYFSIREAANYLAVSPKTVSNYLNTNKLLKGIYLINRKK